MFMNMKFDDGKMKRVRLDTADEISCTTFCDFCDTEIEFAEDEFYEIAVKDGYHGTSWYCDSGCAAEARALQGAEAQPGGLHDG